MLLLAVALASSLWAPSRLRLTPLLLLLPVNAALLSCALLLHCRFLKVQPLVFLMQFLASFLSSLR